MKKTIIATAAAVVFSGTAMAADAIIYNEPAPVVYADAFSWAGGYAGLNAGYGFGKFKNDGDSIKPRGFVGGVQAGYNWQFDGVVAGIEADFQGSNMKKSYTELVIDPVGGDVEEKSTAKVQWFGTIRGRLGAPIADRTLLYGTAGLAYGKVKYTEADNGVTWLNNSKTRAGWTLGAGIEHAFTDNVTFKTEYLYTDLGKAKLLDTGLINEDKVGVKFSTIRAGVNYKF